jgi:tripartite-type tricarboxylate transporter receptor subunit TctC
MKTISRRTVLKLGLASLVASRTAIAQSQAPSDWPSRPVRFLIPFPPGGGGDTVARAVAEKASEILRQPVVVENRTGGNAVIAASAVAQAAPDGYTCLWDGNNHLSNRLLIKDIPFDYRSVFAPVMLTARFPQVLAVRQDFPARSLDKFIAYAHANPGKVSCGTPPSGGMGHLALELLQRRADMQLIHTPYRGGPEATRDVMGGQIDAVLLTTSTIRPALQVNKARLLAITSAQRSTLYPDVPCVAERFPGYDMDDWKGLFVPTGTPDVIVARMNAAVGQALRDPAVVARMVPLGTVLVSTTPAEFATWLAKQREVMEKLIRDANITLTSTAVLAPRAA